MCYARSKCNLSNFVYSECRLGATTYDIRMMHEQRLWSHHILNTRLMDRSLARRRRADRRQRWTCNTSFTIVLQVHHHNQQQQQQRRHHRHLIRFTSRTVMHTQQRSRGEQDIQGSERTVAPKYYIGLNELHNCA